MAEVPESLRVALADRYTLERELGRGGMATVYLAQDLRYNRFVAIKVLNQALTAAVGRARFLREIEIAAQLNHPHILPLLDNGEAGGFLYYVMPFVEGESLKDRIEREKQLPVRDAIAIAREVAAGLHYAHAHGIVHRDVKPGNILLSGGSAVVTDFGIARAIRRSATDDTLTDVNLAIGTPPYMSPEQWSGTRELDARTDIYSLGCVVYEMLAGHPPFTGATTEAIAARVVFDPVPPIRTVRPRVSAALERVILRALEKVAADRFATAAEFADALGAVPLEDTGPVPVPRPAPGRRWAIAAAGGVALATVGVFIGPRVWDGLTGSPDTTRYVLLPFEHRDAGTTLDEDQLLREALTWWSGVSVVDPFRVRDALAKRGGTPTSSRATLRVATNLRAGRFVRGVVSSAGDSIRIYAGLYDATQKGVLLHEGSVTVSPVGRADSAFAHLADMLLFGEPLAGERKRAGTRSYSARQAFARGQEAVDAWDLTAADSAFGAAARSDRNYAQGHLWQALVRAWSGTDPTQWRIASEQASLGRAGLSSRDRGMADALQAQAHGEQGRACALWERLTRDRPLDFAAWYGSARCQANDSAVIVDDRSPTGWRFRSSYHRSLLAYERAFELHPAILEAYRSASFEPLHRLFYTRGDRQRGGRALAPDTTRFKADPSWQGDSLAFVPHRRDALTSMRLTTTATALNQAIERQRERFHDVARTWAAALPRNAAAKEALAVSLAMLGDPAAIDTLRSARTLTQDPGERLLLASREVWLLIAFGLPDHHERLRRARALADSLLRSEPPNRNAASRVLAALAALTGRAVAAATYMRDPRVAEGWTVPPRLRATAPALLTYAALGGPIDTLVALEREVSSLVDHGLPPDQRDAAIDHWLVRAATLAYPTHHFESLAGLADRDNYLLQMQLAWIRRDTLAVRRRLAALREQRRDLSPAFLTIDALYPEADLLAAMGDPRQAAEWLDPTLMTLPQASSEGFVDPVRAAALVRALALRARLAAQLGDRQGAARWAAAVTMLWSDADPFLQPTVAELRELTR